MAIDPYLGHICVTQEPGCTCWAHGNALRERDRLRADLAAARTERDGLREAGLVLANVLHQVISASSIRVNGDVGVSRAEWRRLHEPLRVLGSALARPERGTGAEG